MSDLHHLIEDIAHVLDSVVIHNVMSVIVDKFRPNMTDKVYVSLEHLGIKLTSSGNVTAQVLIEYLEDTLKYS